LREIGAGRGEERAQLARSRGSDGQPRVFDVRSRRLDEEGRVLLVLCDLSESELLARRVGELERYNENIIQNINSALLVIDERGCVVFANPAALQILAVEPEALPGRPVGDWFRDEGERPSLLMRSLLEGVRFKGAETMLSRGDGSVLPVGISCAPLLGAAGETTGAVAIFQDLSEIKQLQRQVLQTEKMASIGQLAAGVAHEINNPVGFIHANLYQMAEYLQDLQGHWEAVAALQVAVESGDVEAARLASQELTRVSKEIDVDFVKTDFVKAVRESQEGSERIRNIVQDLRDFSHQGTAERMLADVNQCVDSTANIVWTMMKDAVVLEKDYADLPQVSCYPMQLKQVFMNLLVNAYQAIEEARARRPAGRSGEERGVIQIQTLRRGDGIVLRIRDTGIGIPKADLARIFDPFFTTKDVGVGTGLGLSISYNIVKRHGGSMRVESEVGSGSLFEVWLPVRFDEEQSDTRGGGEKGRG
jgi:PAS domain S-box-containing protein